MIRAWKLDSDEEAVMKAPEAMDEGQSVFESTVLLRVLRVYDETRLSFPTVEHPCNTKRQPVVKYLLFRCSGYRLLLIAGLRLLVIAGIAISVFQSHDCCLSHLSHISRAPSLYLSHMRYHIISYHYICFIISYLISPIFPFSDFRVHSDFGFRLFFASWL